MAKNLFGLRINDKFYALVEEKSFTIQIAFQQKCIQLLKDFFNNCKCNQNIDNKFKFNHLEKEYKNVFNYLNEPKTKVNSNENMKKVETKSQIIKMNDNEEKKSINNKRNNNNIKSEELTRNTTETQLIKDTKNVFIFGNTLLTEKKIKLNENINEFRNNELKYKCFECEESFSNTKSLSNHKYKVHSIREHVCKECHKKFTHISNLCRHIKSHSNIVKNTGIEYKCDKCDKSFAKIESLRSHKGGFHTIRKYSCNQCDKKFKSRPHLNLHLKAHLRKAINGKYKCNWNGCKHETSQQTNLRLHKLLVHLKSDKNEKFFQCDKCEKGFRSKNALETHLNSIHLGIRFECDWSGCEHKTPSKRRLRLHRMLHTGDMPFECEWPECDLKFRTNNHLNQHKKLIHLNQRDFKCDWPQCEEAFITSRRLELHINKDHKNEKPFECDKCDKSYSGFEALTKHKIIHKKDVLKCDDCSFETRIQNSLKLHKMRKHIKLKRFRCEWNGCQSSFVTNYELREHRSSIHSNERPFVCLWPECKAKFKVKSNLTLHSRTIHKVKRIQ